MTIEALAFFVAIEGEEGDSPTSVWRWSRGGEVLHLRTDVDQPKLTLRDLHGATCN